MITIIIHDRIRAPSNQRTEGATHPTSSYLIDVVRVICVDSDYSGDILDPYTVAVLLEGRVVSGREDSRLSSYGETLLSDVSLKVIGLMSQIC